MNSPAPSLSRTVNSPIELPSNGIAAEIFQRGRVALELLVEARRFAEDLDRNVWNFALEIETLRHRGLMHSDLRWLVCKGYLEQASEILPGAGQERSFHQGGMLSFTDTSCFVVTDVGMELLRKLTESDDAVRPACCRANGELNGAGGSAMFRRHASSPAGATETTLHQPYWDRDRQELRVGDCVVKQFKVPAPNQEVVLAVFHEEGWPVRIDDPLPPRADLEPKRRLHDTINSLNRNQKTPLIRFLGDGTGQGVRWEFTEAAIPSVAGGAA